jgi:hypothetical protein
MYYNVDHVEQPDIIQSFDVFRVPQVTVSESEARNSIDVAIRLFMENEIVKAVEAEAAKFDKNETLVYGNPLSEIPDRSVVFTTPLGKFYLDEEVAHPELTFVTHHTRLNNKIIVLQLKDFGFVAMYSVNYTNTAAAYVHADVRIKFGIAAESATVYNCEAKALTDA